MVSREDKSIILGSVVFILVAFVLTMGLKYNEFISFIAAGIVGIIVGIVVSRLQS